MSRSHAPSRQNAFLCRKLPSYDSAVKYRKKHRRCCSPNALMSAHFRHLRTWDTTETQ
ncbi:8425_t:CDS:2 [Funneliformis mosseae]|uniref:8425_t:CDS:1 n=1 Tax=Funneliformis mosseae TaxID=27381 RepID=A0A9N8ZKM3_FUNMO|nr:8425_t:CDS:2 [Funneliformis mosseae]